MKNIIIIVASAVALLVASVGTSLFLVNYVVDEKMAGAVVTEEGEHAEPETIVEPAVYLALDPFIVNFVQNGALRYLQITMELMSRNAEVIELTESSVPEIRNSLILILSDHSYDVLASRDGKEMIRQQVQDEVNRIIGKEHGIESVYLTGFVMQ